MPKESIVVNGQPVLRSTMREFKRQYMKAKERGLVSYIYEGQEVITDYAKYLVEYAELEMGPLD